QHFHADHPVFSCSKSEQKQLNTWVSFQSAEEPLLGQFSVSGNSQCRGKLRWRSGFPSHAADTSIAKPWKGICRPCSTP
ncbi:hypothetical protein, partial [Pseudomonas viridiflava]|uniref:hypothetical protein n=1 Tax=Pseudomonas viridiflava TaxID=33069 RepID=UPI000F04055B